MGILERYRQAKQKELQRRVKAYLYANDSSYKKTEDSLKRDDYYRKRVKKAEEQYQRTGNINPLIREYETVLFKTDCKIVPAGKLVDAYIKAGRNNDAWAYLNKLSATTNKGTLSWIRLTQAKILKQEGRNSDAIDSYMRGHLFKASSWGEFTRSTFLRDISSPAHKLGLSKSDKEALADMVEKQALKKDFNEQALRQKYITYLKRKGL